VLDQVKGLAQDLLKMGQAEEKAALKEKEKQAAAAERTQKALEAEQLKTEEESYISGVKTELLETIGTAAEGPVEEQLGLQEKVRSSIDAKTSEASTRFSTKPILRERVTQRLAGLSPSLLDHARQIENTGRVQTIRAQVDDVLEGLTRRVGLAPGELRESMAEGLALIASSRTHNPKEKEALSDAFKQRTYEQAFLSQGRRDPGRMLKELKAGGWDPVFSQEKLLQLENVMQGRINAAEALQERGRREALRGISRMLDDDLASVAATGEGIPGLYQRARALMEPEAFQEYDSKRTSALLSHTTWEGIRYAPPDQAAKQIEAMRPAAGVKDFAVRQRAYESVREAYTKAQNLLQQDPAAYVASDPGVKTFADRITRQESMGIPAEAQRVFSKKEAHSIVAKMNATPPEKRADFMRDVKQELGPLYPHALKDMAELANFDARNQLLTALADDPWSPQILPHMAQALTLGEKELKKALPQDAPKQIREALDSELADFSRTMTLGDRQGGRVSFLNDIRESVELTAMNLAAQGLKPAEAAKKAAALLVNNRYQIRDTWRAPYTVDAGKVERYADHLLSSVEAFNPVAYGTAQGGIPKVVIKNPDGSFSTEKTITIDVDTSQGKRFLTIPTIVGGRELSQEDAIAAHMAGRNPAVGEHGSQQEAQSFAKGRSAARVRVVEDLYRSYLKHLRRKGIWTTNEDESGLVLLDGDLGLPVIDATGRRLEFRWDDALSWIHESPSERGQRFLDQEGLD
jgi:hypothetical protein